MKVKIKVRYYFTCIILAGKLNLPRLAHCTLFEAGVSSNSCILILFVEIKKIQTYGSHNTKSFILITWGVVEQWECLS